MYVYVYVLCMRFFKLHVGQGFKILKVCGLKDETEDIEEVEEEEGYGTSNYLEGI